jgi:hypothetical protein
MARHWPDSLESPLIAVPPAFAELHCLTNFTFLRGASHASELVARAAQLGYAALAVTDECSLAGIVRAHEAAKEHGLPLVVGTEVRLADGPKLVLLATNREGYGNLAQLITTGRRAAAKGEYRLTRADLADGVPGCLVLWVPGAGDGVAGDGVADVGPVGGGHAPESGGCSESASIAPITTTTPATTDSPGDAAPATNDGPANNGERFTRNQRFRGHGPLLQEPAHGKHAARRGRR